MSSGSQPIWRGLNNSSRFKFHRLRSRLRLRLRSRLRLRPRRSRLRLRPLRRSSRLRLLFLSRSFSSFLGGGFTAANKVSLSAKLGPAPSGKAASTDALPASVSDPFWATSFPPTFVQKAACSGATGATTCANFASWSAESCAFTSSAPADQKSKIFVTEAFVAPRGKRPCVRKSNCASGILDTLSAACAAAASKNSLQDVTLLNAKDTLMSCPSGMVSNFGKSASAARPYKLAKADSSATTFAFANASNNFDMSSKVHAESVAADALATRPRTGSATAADFEEAVASRTSVSVGRPSSICIGTLPRRPAHVFTSSPSPFSPKPAMADAMMWMGAVWHNKLMTFAPTVPSPFS
mmetsp:Transcript_106006/g.236629  ORF Transcript_106006/g.236629 Transcript_106006/m.236629 type:complete len:353 (-) Transcript_106006:663-1721(-)